MPRTGLFLQFLQRVQVRRRTCRVLLWAAELAGLGPALIRVNVNATPQRRRRSNLNAASNKQGCAAALQPLYPGTACRALG